MPTSASNDWLVSVPLSQLVAMQNNAGELDKLRDENNQLKRRIDGLHRTIYDMMEVVSELRKSVKVSAYARPARVG